VELKAAVENAMGVVMKKETAKRALIKGGKSDPETPPGDKKKQKAVDGAEDDGMDSEVEMVPTGEAAAAQWAGVPVTMEAMAKLMQSMIQQSNADMRRCLRDSVAEAKDEILEEVHEMGAKVESIAQRQDGTDTRLKKMEEKFAEMEVGKPKTWKDVAEDGEEQWQEVKGKGKGKTKGKEAEKNEELARTVVFNGYGEGVRADDVIQHIKEAFVSGVDDDCISETYAYGKTYASGGAVRFKSEKSMWRHLVENKGENWKMYKDRKVYARPGRREGEDMEKSKAIRKAVRAIYEVGKMPIEELKKETQADYRKGVVKFKGYMVAQWTETYGSGGLMEWVKDYPEFAARHEELMAKAAA
jgi:hypothetical protein